MLTRTIRGVVFRIAAGSLTSLSITWVAFHLHFNLSAATSVHLLLVTVIALRWGLIEASVVSLLSVACLDYFFTDPRKRHIVAVSRRNERKVFPSDPKARSIPWHFETLDFRANERKLNGYLAHFHSLPSEKITPHYHRGVELLYLIEGELEITIGIDKFLLSAGDSIYFDSLQKHAYRSLGQKSCTAVVVTTTSAV